jgi:class 3 adenylate cyclase
MNRAAFFQKLEARPADLDAAVAYDAEMAAQLTTTVAILVTDLSGFTRLTKKHGILHFLSVFARAVRLATPHITDNRGTLLKTAADNMIAVFPDPKDALAAARGMIGAAHEDSDHHPADGHVRICCGIGFGPIMLLDDDCFGDEVNVAFKLGEDVAEPEEILISKAAAEFLEAEGADGFDGPHSAGVGGVDLIYYATSVEP